MPPSVLLRFIRTSGAWLGENACSNLLAVEPALRFAAKLRVEAPDEPSSGERKNSDGDYKWQAGFHAGMLPQASDDSNVRNGWKADIRALHRYSTRMSIESKQRLVGWSPHSDLEGKTASFGDIAIHSPEHQRLSVTLPYEEGELRIDFNDVRAFMTSWDGDTNPYLTHDEALSRPSDLFKVEASRWLSSDYFRLDVESSFRTSDKPWEHFCILSGERSLHVAARDDIELTWVAN